MNESQLYEYEMFWDEVNRAQVLKESNYNRGREEGREEERERARKEKLDSARSLKENGVPTDIIAKSLGLTAEEIAVL